MNQNVIVITGPTASGKTAFTLRLAEHADIEIISADSRQVFRHLNIGTAKPLQSELDKVTHHLIDILNPDEEFNAGMFADKSVSIIHDIKKRGKVPVVTGGTGFYIKALFEGLSAVDELDKSIIYPIRERLNKQLEDEGKESLYQILGEKDEKAAARYSDMNPRRIIRALEYIEATGKKFSDTFGMEFPSGYLPQYYVINPSRDELYKTINKRTESMFDNGFIREVAAILEMGYDTNLNSLNTVGYKECIAFIFGDYPIDKAIELTKQNTRKYAKRQITWLNQLPSYTPLNPHDPVIFGKILDRYSGVKK